MRTPDLELQTVEHNAKLKKSAKSCVQFTERQEKMEMSPSSRKFAEKIFKELKKEFTGNSRDIKDQSSAVEKV